MCDAQVVHTTIRSFRARDRRIPSGWTWPKPKVSPQLRLVFLLILPLGFHSNPRRRERPVRVELSRVRGSRRTGNWWAKARPISLSRDLRDRQRLGTTRDRPTCTDIPTRRTMHSVYISLRLIRLRGRKWNNFVSEDPRCRCPASNTSEAVSRLPTMTFLSAFYRVSSEFHSDREMSSYRLRVRCLLSFFPYLHSSVELPLPPVSVVNFNTYL